MFGGWGIDTDIFPRKDAICIGEDMLLKGAHPLFATKRSKDVFTNII